jgi:CheY-like chemotaxis protein
MAVILIVDDESDNIDVVDYALRSQGHTVVGIQNPAQALAHIEASQPDLMILDLNLSYDYNGVTLGREIRQGIAPDTPMIAVTAAVLSYNQADVLAAGFDAFVHWPISVSDLRELVGSYV